MNKQTQPPRRRLASLLTVLCLFAFSSAHVAAPPSSAEGVQAPTRARRALVISLDGLDARYLRDADRLGLRIPSLRRLMSGGAWARAGVVGVYPSVTYPSHTTLVTGAHPSRHGIVSNTLFEPPPRRQTGAWFWFARDIRADTLWDAAARRGLKSGLISWPVAAGAGDWNVPEIFKPSGTREQTLGLMREHARPRGLLEEVARADPRLFAAVTPDEGDDMRTRFAEHVISQKRPEVVLVHLFDLDHFQHDYGPFTPEALAMLEKADGYVGRLLAAAGRAGTLSETAVFVVSDHGFLPVKKLIHPGVLLAKAGLLSVEEQRDAKGVARPAVKSWDALHHVSGGSCAIILRRGARGAGRRARLFLEGESARGGRRLYRVLGGRELRRLGSNPGAAFMLEAAEGYSFGDNLTGEIVTDSKQLGQHGYLPARADYRASFVASGAGVTRRGDLGEVRMIDIGPTIARLLGLTLRDAEGRPLRLR